MMDFIPLSSGSSNHKSFPSSFAKKDQRKKQRGDNKRPHNHNQGQCPPTGESPPVWPKRPLKDLLPHTSFSSFSKPDPRLRQRIMDYLERNKYKEYIDIEEMSRQLRSKHPEYGRKKLREFQRCVTVAFDKLQSEAAIEKVDEPQIVANVINLSEEEEEEDDEMQREIDSTRVNGQSMNRVLSGLYLPGGQNNAAVIVKEEEEEEEVMIVGDDDDDSRKEVPELARVTKGLKDRLTYNPDDRSTKSPRTPVAAARINGRKIQTDVEVIETAPGATKFPPTPAPESTSRLKSRIRAATELNTPTSTSTTTETPSQRRTLTKRKDLLLSPAVTPKVTFSNIGGCGDAINELYKASRHLVIPQIYRQLGVPPPRGCILHGPPGCGKTLLANALAGTLGVQMITVSGTELISGISGDSEGKIRSLFDQVKHLAAPCILFIEGLDVIAKKRDSAQRDMEMRIVSQLIASLDDLNNSEIQEEVFVVGATDRLEVIDPALRTGKRLEREIALGIPDAKARKMILEVMCRDFCFEEECMDFDTLARLTPGYVGSDLRALITAAAGFAEDRYYLATEKTFYASRCVEAGERKNWSACKDLSDWLKSDESLHHRLNGLSITFHDFQSALKVVKPSAMKEGFATVPNVSFDDIGALDDIRRELEMAICAPVRYPDLAKSLGLDVPSGVLLCGPPGCGKTLLAKAVANQAGINFLSVKGPEIMNMYVGESERAIRQIFQRARNSAPCVIFFDEIDSICPRRSSGTDGGSGSNRVVNQMLTEMDGVEGRRGVYVMGASNRVDMIDEAILRPGRLTNIFFVGLPDPQGREDILRKLTKNWTKPRLAPDVDLASLARSDACGGFSGADLGNLVSRAAQFRMEELCGDSRSAQIAGDAVVGLEHFKRAFGCVKPSVSGRLKKRYELMRQTYSGGVAKFVSGPVDRQVLLLPMDTEDQQHSTAQGTSSGDTPADSGQPPKASSVKMRYLEMMEVRVKATADTLLASAEGYVVAALTDHCTVRTDVGRDVVVEAAVHLEPFIPEEGEMVKVLLEGGPLTAGRVVAVNNEDEEARIEFPGGEEMVFPLDQLCKVRLQPPC